MNDYHTLIIEKSVAGRAGYQFPALDVPEPGMDELITPQLQRKERPHLPEVSEVDVVRHYTHLSMKSFSVDTGSYPLGSCTMKYNPKAGDDAAALEGFGALHPLQPAESVQGILKLQYRLLEYLAALTGMQWGTLQPFAGAHGEYTGMKLCAAYFRARGETDRKVMLVPSSSHGTNPASAHLAGFDVVEVKADSRGLVSLEDLEQYLDDKLAGIMLTNPNTLGLFETDIARIATRVHEAGGLLYYDGANFNAIMGKTRPGDMGFDIIHLNLHKTFATPHGGGGPGAGPVLVCDRLVPFLPNPDIEKSAEGYRLADSHDQSIGRLAGFYGNVGVLIRALTYITIMGSDGLEEASEHAVLFANYIKEELKDSYDLGYDRTCMHEFVLSAKTLKEQYGVAALDIAKGLIDAGIHPPTVYFPLIVPEAMMIEPTETESKAELDRFIEVMRDLARKSEEEPDTLHAAPVTTPVGRVDEVLAARKPKVRWSPEEA
ncbi:MAG: aminomethyl-transferring glycine dehydrogenase subunit GcvPB [Spirochaetota bacterium]